MKLLDSHCHLQDARFNENIDKILFQAQSHNITHLVSCGCYEEDWIKLISLIHKQQEQHLLSSITIHPSFGLHPWWAGTKGEDYLHKLKSILLAHPHAGLGEIGFCKSKRGKSVDIATQEAVFLEQLQLAVELHRTTTIHCVRYHGKLLSCLKASPELPTAIVLHSYSGSKELVRNFLSLNAEVYFSFNGKQIQAKKGREAMLHVPLTLLLFETDSPDQAFPTPSSDHPELNYPENLRFALEIASHLLIEQGTVESLKDLCTVVYENSVRAFSLNAIL